MKNTDEKKLVELKKFIKTQNKVFPQEEFIKEHSRIFIDEYFSFNYIPTVNPIATFFFAWKNDIINRLESLDDENGTGIENLSKTIKYIKEI